MHVVFPSTAKHGLQHRSSRHLHNLCSLTTQLNFWIIFKYLFAKSQPREERVDVLPAATAHLNVTAVVFRIMVGIVYGIRDKREPDVVLYVGSTSQRLRNRWNGHRCDFKRKKISVIRSHSRSRGYRVFRTYRAGSIQLHNKRVERARANIHRQTITQTEQEPRGGLEVRV